MTQLRKLFFTLFEELIEIVNEEKKTAWSETINNAMIYIRAHLDENIKLEDISESVYMNPNYFSSLFTKEVGMPVFQWIKHERVNEAKQLLIQDSRPIIDIAFQTGFKNQSHFTQVFKAITGKTPREYRRDYS